MHKLRHWSRGEHVRLRIGGCRSDTGLGLREIARDQHASVAHEAPCVASDDEAFGLESLLSGGRGEPGTSQIRDSIFGTVMLCEKSAG